ncbi:Hypothetical_protein [Hexamita inflata]|uniref:Hypothetical_protein n=1 Tax=Hexamita inflata TaxID=28002 RepID=A0AA86RRK8_9EUKA|nr:Hypothetical protein HINF_LOCUS64434 [Hexamita inflata]
MLVQPLRLSNDELSQVIAAPNTYSGASDSVGITKWQTVIHSGNKSTQLIENINTRNYYLNIELRRIEYLMNCNAKNLKVLNSMKKNQIYFSEVIIKLNAYDSKPMEHI